MSLVEKLFLNYYPFAKCVCLVSVLDRPSSRMSFLDQFLKDTSQRLAHSDSGESAGAGDEADVEDNQPASGASSKSTVSEDGGVSTDSTTIWC